MKTKIFQGSIFKLVSTSATKNGIEKAKEKLKESFRTYNQVRTFYNENTKRWELYKKYWS